MHDVRRAGSALHIDPHEFHRGLYTLILELGMSRIDREEEMMLLRALELFFITSRKARAARSGLGVGCRGAMRCSEGRVR